MKRAAAFRLVLVTAPDLKTARGLAKAALTGQVGFAVGVVASKMKETTRDCPLTFPLEMEGVPSENFEASWARAQA